MIRIMLVDYDPGGIGQMRNRLSVDKDIEVIGEAQNSQRALQLMQS